MDDFFDGAVILISCPNCKSPLPVLISPGEIGFEECRVCSYLPEPNQILPQVEAGQADTKLEQWTIIDATPANDEVICDLCNAEIDDQMEGGSFSGSYALCSECTQRIWRQANEEERKEIQLVQGPFKLAVLRKRILDSLR